MTIIEQAEHTLQKAARYRDDSKSALQEAAELQQEAIDLLLAEREQIDARLAQLGYGAASTHVKRRGRPPLPKSVSLPEAVNKQLE